MIATADALEDGFDNNLYFHALDAALHESLPELAQADTAAETIWRTIQHLA